jgi:excisionase family DNA binding protein
MALTIPARRADAGNVDAGQPGTGESSPGNKKLYRVPEAMRLLSRSRSVIYAQIRLGRLRSVKQGNARLIPADTIAAYVVLLEAEAEEGR